jgi:hypothetical protein
MALVFVSDMPKDYIAFSVRGKSFICGILGFMDLTSILAALQTVQQQVQQALSSAAGTAAKLVGLTSIQTGNGELVNGSIAIVLGPGKLNSNSHIVATIRAPLAGGGSLATVVGLAVPDFGRNFATGAFLVQAIDGGGFAVGTAQCSFDYVIVTTG